VTTESLDAERRLRVSPSVYARTFGAELVLLDFGRGEYFGLDEVGAEIWRAIAAGETLGAIADRVAERYEVTRSRALADIVQLAAHMLGQGLLLA
jgi:hypothetical protein